MYWFSGDVVCPNTYLCIFGTSGDKKTMAMRRTFSASLLSGAPQVEIVSSVGTPGGLAEHFSNSASDRNICLFFSEEFASLLSRGRWSGATILEFLTETFDCPETWGLRYRKKNAVSITERTPTILTGTTTDWFWKSARPEDFCGGCLNRFLFLTGPKKAPIPDPTPVDARVDRVRQVITDLRGLAGSGGIEAHWAGNAKQRWREYYTGHERVERDGLLGAACKRIHVYVRKLALAYAACEKTLPEVTAEQLNKRPARVPLRRNAEGIRMTVTTIAPVTPETLAAAFGITNQAHHQAPDDWALLASERLAERFGPDAGAALLARIVALSRYLDSGDGPQHYRKHGAANLLPGLVRAAAMCGLDADTGCFDRAALEALAAMPGEPLCPHCGRRAAA